MSKMTESRKQQKPQKVTSEWADLAESKNELEGKLYKRNNVQADNWYELSTSLKDMEAKRQFQYKELENQRSKIVPSATGNIDALNAKYFKSLSDYGEYWGDQAAYDEGFQKYQEAMSRLSGQYESHIKKHRESDKASDAQLPKTFTTETAKKRIDDLNNRYFRDNSLYRKMARDAETVQDNDLLQKALQGAQMAEENYNNAYLSANQAYLSTYEKERPAEFYYQTMTQKDLEAELQKLKESETTTPFQLMPKEQWEAELQKYKNGELTPYYQIVSAPEFEDEFQSYNDDALNNLTKKAAIEQALKWKTADARRAKYEEIKAAFMHQGDELLPAYSSANQSLAQKGKSMYDEDERKIIVGGEEYIDLGAPYESGIAKTYAERGPEDGYLEEWQKEIFYALYARDKEIAQEWMDLAQEQAENEHFNKIENRFSQGLARIPGLPLAATLSLAGGISPYSERGQKLSKTAEAITAGGARALTEKGILNTGLLSGTIDEDVPILGGKGLGDLYQLAESMVQSGALAVGSAAAGRYDAALGAVVGFLGTALMGGSAAASDYRESLARGMTKEQAMRHATAAGIAEAAFEHISLDKLVNMNISKGFWKNVFTQGGIEASEELCTTIANRISDGLLARAEGYDTQIEHRVKELVALGENWKDAENKAAQEWMTDLINDGLGGFISGGMMSAGSTFAQWDAYKSTMEQFGSGVSAAERAALQAYAADNGIDISKMAQASEITESTDSSAPQRSAQNDNGAEGLQVSDATEKTDEQHGSDAQDQNVAEKNKKSTRETRSEKKTNRKQGEALTRVVDSIEQKVLDAGLKNAERVYNTMVSRYGENISRAAEAAVVRVAAREFSAAYETSNEAAEKAYKAAMQATKAKPVQKAIQEAWKGASLEAANHGNEKALQNLRAGIGTGGTLKLNAEITTKDGGTQQVQIAALGAEKGKVRLNNGEVVELDALQGLDADTKDVIQRLDAFDLGAARSLAFQEYRLATEKGEVTDGVRWVMNYALAYDQGRTGAISLQEAIRRSSLPAETVTNAYTQGQEATEKWRQDKENENARKRENAKKGATGRKGILDSSRVSQEKMDRISTDKQDAIRTMELLAEATGVDIRLIAQKSDQKGNVKGYQGLYNRERNYIEIDINAGLNNIFDDLHTGMTAVLGHELTHWMQENAPTEYLAYKKAVLQAIMSTKNGELRLERMIEAQINQNKREGKEITRSEAEDEVVADASMKRMGDTEFWDAVADNLGEKKADVAARIRDYISKFFQRVRELLRKASHTSEAARIVDQAEADVQANLRKLYAELTGAAMRNSVQTWTETKNAATEGGEGQYATRQANGKPIAWIKNSQLSNSQLSDHQAVADFIAEHIGDVYTILESGQKVYIGEEMPTEYTQSKYTKSILQRKNKLNAKNRVLSNLKDVVEIATNRRWEKTKHPGTKDAKYGMYRYDTSFAFPTKNRDGSIANVRAYDAELVIRNASDGKKYLYDIVNLKENTASALDLLQKETRRGSYAAQRGGASEKRIAQEAPSVKPSDEILSTRSDTDSTGRELSEGQQAYFKDSRARDINGNLLVLYHQTENNFTVFDPRHEGAGTRDQQTPFGIFLKSSDRDIGVKGKKQMALYANITKPLVALNRDNLESKLRDLSPEYAKLSDQHKALDREYKQKHEQAKQAFTDYLTTWREQHPNAGRSEIYKDADFDRLWNAEDEIIDEWEQKARELETETKEVLTNALEAAGYDGIFLGNDTGSWGRSTDAYIALHPEQVKNVDNLNPTGNHDIRYSTRDYSDLSDLDLLLNAANEISEGGGEDYWASLLESNPGLAGEAEEIKRLGKQLRDTEAKLAEARRNLTLTDRKLRTRGISTLAATIMQDQKAGDSNKKDVKNRITSVLTEAYQKALDQLDAGADVGTAWDTVYNEGVAKAADILLTDATYAEKLGYKLYKNTLGAYLGEGAREYVEADIASRVAQDFDANRYRPGQNGTVADRLVAQAESRVNKKLDAAKTENAALRAENAKLTEAKDFYKEQAETAKATAGELYQQLLNKREELKNNKKISADERKTTLKKLDNLERQMKAKRREAEVWKSKAETGWKAASQAIRDRDAAVEKLEKQFQRERDILSGKLKPPAIQKMLKAAREREAERVTQHKDEVFARYKEGKKASDLRKRIKNLSDDMKRTMVKPTDGSYVPASLYGSMTKLADALDDFLAPNDGTKAESRYRAVMDKIHALSSEYQAVATLDDPVYSSEYDEEIQHEINELVRTLQGANADEVGTINMTPAKARELSVEELQKVYDIMKYINYCMKTAKSMMASGTFQSVYDAMGQIVEQQQSMKPLTEVSKHEQNKRERLLNKLNVMRAVEMMSGYDREAALYQIMQAVENGTVDVESWIMQYNKAFESLKTGKNELKYRNSLTKLLDYGVQDERGNAVKMTKMQAIQLLMIAEREAHNKDLIHLSSGGAVIRDAKAMRNGKEGVAHTIRVTPELIKRIQDSMTAWDKAYMQTMRNYLAKEGRTTNRVLYKLKHRVLQTEDYYMPYSVDKDYLDTKIDESNYDNLGVQTPGSTQTLKRKAPQPVIIDGADAFMAHHVREMAKYIGLAIPIRDFAKVYNGRLKQGENENPLPVKKTIGDNFGKEGQKLLIQALIDVQKGRSNNNHRTKIGQLLSTLQSMFYRKSLLINASVTIKQAASYAAAASIIDYDLLERANHPLWSAKDVDESKAFGAGGLIRHLFLAPSGKAAQRIFNEIDAHTSSHYIRRQGMSMREIASEANKNGPVKQAIGMAGAKLEQVRGGHQVRTALESLDPISWIQRMDAATTATLWVACKLQAKRDGFSVGSAEYWNHTTELYERVLRETQPMYDSLHRNNYQKDKEGIVQYIFPFRTVPIQNHGQLVNAFENYKAAKESGDKARIKKANRFFRKTVVAQTASAAIFAVMTFLANAAKRKTKKYRDEDEELTLESLALGLGYDTVGTLISVFAPLAGNALWDTATNVIDAAKTGKNVRSYDAFSVGVVDLLNNAWNSTEGLVKDFAQMVGGKDVSKDTFLKDLQKFISSGLEAAGFPASTVKTYTQGIIGNVNDVLEGRIPALNDASWERSNATNARRLIKALEAGDEAKAEAVMEEIRRNILKDKPNLKTDKVNAKIQSAVQSYVKQQYLDDEISEEKAIHYMVEYGSSDDENDAFWKIREWDAREAWDGEAEDFAFSKYTKIREIVDNVGDISEEMQYLQDHGVKFEDANKEIKSYIGKQLKAGEYDEAEAIKTLQAYHKVKDERTKQYRPDTDDEAWFTVQEWQANAEHAGDEDYSWNKYEDLFAAMDKGGDIEPHADELESHGINADTIKNAVVAHVKERYELGEVNASKAMRLLQKYRGMDSNEAYWKVDEWDAKEAAYKAGEEFTDSNYRDLYAAIDANKDASAAVRELTEHGYKERNVYAAAKDHLVKRFEEGKINQTQFENQLSWYAKIVKSSDVSEIVTNAKCYKETGYRLGTLNESYLDGEITAEKYKQIRVKYGGKTTDEAKKQVRWLDLKKSYPSLEITESVSNSWYDGTAKTRENGRKSAKAAGMSIEAYLRAKEVLDKIKDSNGNNTGEDEVIAALAKMNLTPQQKDALYYERYKGTTKYSRKKW